MQNESKKARDECAELHEVIATGVCLPKINKTATSTARVAMAATAAIIRFRQSMQTVKP